MSRYGKGYIKDPPHRRTQKLSHELVGTAPANPPQGTLERFEVKTFDQGQTGSCCGHGTAAALAVSSNASTGAKIGFVPSPRTIYAVLRTVEKQKPTDPLTDSGAMPSDIGPTAQAFGVRPMQGPTPDGRNSDIWSDADLQGVAHPPPANVNTEESLGDLLVAGTKLVLGIYRIDETQASYKEQIKAAVCAGYAVGAGVFADSAFESWSPTKQPEGLKTVDFSDPDGGGHWICLDAYKTNPDGSVTFSGPNSWSDQYGAGALVDTAGCPNPGGHWRATDAWLDQQAAQGMDIYVFKIESVGGAS